MSARVVLVGFMAITGCGDAVTGSDAAVPDLAADDGGMDDLSVDGGAVDDLSPAPDLFDDHVPLKIVGNAVPLKQDGGVDYYEIHVKEAQQQVLPGPMTTIWGFEGEWPGKTVHATLGRPVTIRIFNDLPVAESLSIHNHGHNVQAAFDGHPSENVIPQNTFYDYKYQNRQAGPDTGIPPNLQGAATYFFHDHVQDLTAPHFYKGIEAFYIIHPEPGSREAALNLPSGDYDIPLIVQDRSFNADNSLEYTVNPINGFQGDYLTVNGTIKPYLEVARRKYRFRILDGSNARRINFGLSRGTMYQIATDGGLLKNIITASRIALAPAERVDVVIDFAQYKIGDVITIVNDDLFAPVQPEILQFRVVRDEPETSSLPFNLNGAFVRYTESFPPPSPTPSPRPLQFSFDNASSQWRINGQTFNPAAVEFPNVKIGNVEVWELANDDPVNLIPHPFHQHLVEFQILTVCPVSNRNCTTAPPPFQTGWKDTVLVPPQTVMRIKMHMYYSGPDAFQQGHFVFHCHNLEHEDHAMMLQQTISP